MTEKTASVDPPSRAIPPAPTSPEFWREYARGASENPVAQRSLDAGCWDRAAATYDDLESCRDYTYQVGSVISSLVERGAVRPGGTVLDVACGTGTYAVRMAPHCSEVVCLDISSGMIEKLREKKRLLGIENITAVKADWLTYRPDKKFDLVFTSMTPLFRSMDNVDRMLEASGRFLAIVSWAGVRENEILNAIARELLGEALHGRGADIVVIFNYLYSLGLAPDLRFFHGCWERTRAVEEQTESLLRRLELRRPLLTGEERNYVEETVRALAENGLVTLKTRVRTAFMFVDKEAGSFPC
jgi:SAM-dependent methyltransferase